LLRSPANARRLMSAIDSLAQAKGKERKIDLDSA
jgi:PHD/YefM family antitoxin component YafN of YafNO toxin-antitoxin module